MGSSERLNHMGSSVSRIQNWLGEKSERVEVEGSFTDWRLVVCWVHCCLLYYTNSLDDNVKW